MARLGRGQPFKPKVGKFIGAAGGTTHTTTGALTGPGSTVAGTAAHLTLHSTTGVLTGPGSAVVGAAVHPHTTTGALTGAGSTVAGAAAHTSPGVHPTTGALVGPGASISGTATRLALHTTSGILVGQGSTVAGAVSLNGAVADTGRQQGGGRGGKRQRRKTIVEIDGEEYIVGSVEEAKHLLEQKRQALLDAAPAAAKKALNKARDVQRKTGTMPELVVEVPAIEVEDEASVTMKALADRAQRAINEAYAQAAQSAELALLARRAYMAQDEEDAIAVLLLS